MIGNAIRSGKPYGFALLIFTAALSSEGEVHGEARLCSKVIPGAPDYLDGKVMVKGDRPYPHRISREFFPLE